MRGRKSAEKNCDGTNCDGNAAGVSPSTGVGEGVGAGEGDSASWSNVPRFLLSRDLAMTIWALRASCSKDFMLGGGEEKTPNERHKKKRRRNFCGMSEASVSTLCCGQATRLLGMAEQEAFQDKDDLLAAGRFAPSD